MAAAWFCIGICAGIGICSFAVDYIVRRINVYGDRQMWAVKEYIYNSYAAIIIPVAALAGVIAVLLLIFQ